ncbi:MAG: OsmC family protein [Aliidongia sp.]
MVWPSFSGGDYADFCEWRTTQHRERNQGRRRSGLIGAVQADSRAGLTRWSVSNAWQGRTHSRAQVRSFEIGGVPVARSFTIDLDEPFELGGADQYANPQEYLLAALNACIVVGYVALCSVQGITLEKLEVRTEGEIDLRGFFGLDPTVSPGYDGLRTHVTIKGDASEEQFRKIHDMVMATSPNVHNISKAVLLHPTLMVE